MAVFLSFAHSYAGIRHSEDVDKFIVDFRLKIISQDHKKYRQPDRAAVADDQNIVFFKLIQITEEFTDSSFEFREAFFVRIVPFRVFGVLPHRFFDFPDLL